MKSLRFLDRRIGFSVGALGLLFSMMAPAAIPALASAATLTTRSIDMSSTAVSATSSYKVTFTPGTSEASGYVVLWFCDNTPLVGSTCSAPSGMSLASATLVSPPGSEAILTTGTDTYQGAGANWLVFKGADLTASTAYTITVGGVTNPSVNETFYGRIETFSTLAAAKAAGGDTTGSDGGTANGLGVSSIVDSGSVALSTNNTLGVQAAVLESLTFCLFGDPGNLSGAGTANNASDSATYLTGTSNSVGTINSNNLDDIGSTALGNGGTNLTDQAPGADCSDSGAATYAGGTSHTNGFVTPSVTLGQYVANGIYALNTSSVSYADDWSQLSTNANGGAAVYLQSGNSCSGGGLSISGGASCGIPAATGSLTAGTAGFGVALGTPVSLDSNPVTANDGSITPNATYNSGTPQYALGAASNGTYGDSFYTTGSHPATNWDVPIGIGATISNNTAAGNYSDNLNLVAVGTF
jgi:hypothetical protein